MPRNAPTSSIEGNTETVVELLSNHQIFEAISNVFFKRFRSSGYERFFDDEEDRKLFINENLLLIIFKLNQNNSFKNFLSRLKEIYLLNNDDLGIGIVENLKSKKFVLVGKSTDVTVQLEDKKGDKMNGVSTEILLLSEKLKVDVDELLVTLLNQNASYFEKLDKNLGSTYSENGVVLGTTKSDIAFITRNSSN